jgi:hypothetical protein
VTKKIAAKKGDEMGDDNPYSPPHTPPDAVPVYDKVKIAAVPAGLAVCILVTGVAAAVFASGLPPPAGGLMGLAVGMVAGVMATRHCFRVANLARPRKPRQ